MKHPAAYWLYVAKSHPVNAILFVFAVILLLYAVMLPSLSHLVVAVTVVLVNLGLVYAERQRRSPQD